MFEESLQVARTSLTNTVDSYLNRAAVTILFVVAASFAVAAIMIALVQEVGGIAACLIVGAVFALAGLITWGVVSSIERRRERESRVQPDAKEAFKDDVKAAALDPRAALGYIPIAVNVGRMLGGRVIALSALAALAFIAFGTSAQRANKSGWRA